MGGRAERPSTGPAVGSADPGGEARLSASSASICVQARGRPSLFGVAELDNVMADGGGVPGMGHIVEAACRGGQPDAGCNARAATAFATGFAARSGAPALWIGPPRDLLTPHALPEGIAAAGLQIVESRWTAGGAVRLQQVAGAGVRVLILDVRRAERLSAPLRLAQTAVKKGFVVVLLALDAAQIAGRPGAPEACWRIGMAPGMEDDAVEPSQPCWQVELVRGEAVRRVLVRACDSNGRMATAPRDAQLHGGKEMMRRFTRA